MKPVFMPLNGTMGRKSPSFAGTGANGPRGPFAGGSIPVCCACSTCPSGTGEEPSPIPRAYCADSAGEMDGAGSDA